MDGGVLYIEGELNVSIVGLNVSSIRAKSAAALCVSGVVSAINSSYFMNLTSTNGEKVKECREVK
jgi:hypothetical protein